MNKNAIDINLLEFAQTAHNTGRKKVMFHGDGASLTQFAFARLEANEHIAPHMHPTMDEYFYFLAGSGTYIVSEQSIALQPGIAIKIEAGAIHELMAESALEFIYFGLATGK